MKTFSAKTETVKRDWFVVNADGKTLGRLATEIARRLRGKHKAIYTPHVDTGDYIVVINAEKVKVTGKKASGKIYYWHQVHQLRKTDSQEARSGAGACRERHVAKRPIGPLHVYQAQGIRGPRTQPHSPAAAAAGN